MRLKTSSPGRFLMPVTAAAVPAVCWLRLVTGHLCARIDVVRTWPLAASLGES